MGMEANNVLQHTAIHCVHGRGGTGVAVCCSVSQFLAVCCSVCQCAARTWPWRLTKRPRRFSISSHSPSLPTPNSVIPPNPPPRTSPTPPPTPLVFCRFTPPPFPPSTACINMPDPAPTPLDVCLFPAPPAPSCASFNDMFAPFSTARSAGWWLCFLWLFAAWEKRARVRVYVRVYVCVCARARVSVCVCVYACV